MVPTNTAKKLNLPAIVYISAIIGIIAVLFGSVFQQASAIKIGDACDNVGAQTSVCASKDENIKNSFAKSITNTALFVLGFIAVVMIIMGGIRYATSNGDPSNITAAKNTIMYSVVGLIVAIMAWGIVTFVVNQFS